MIRITLHVPGFIDVGDDFQRSYSAATWDELVATERLAGWASDPQFGHWCVSDRNSARPLLMAEMIPRDAERLFWVIAFVSEGSELLSHLPDWVEP